MSKTTGKMAIISYANIRRVVYKPRIIDGEVPALLYEFRGIIGTPAIRLTVSMKPKTVLDKQVE